MYAYGRYFFYKLSIPLGGVLIAFLLPDDNNLYIHHSHAETKLEKILFYRSLSKTGNSSSEDSKSDPLSSSSSYSSPPSVSSN